MKVACASGNEHVDHLTPRHQRTTAVNLHLMECREPYD